MAGTLTSEADPKVSTDTGAVEMLAAVVTPTCSGSGPGRNEKARVSGLAITSRPTTAPNDSWKLTSKRLLGFTVSSHAAGASQSSQPSLGREARIASNPQMPATPARTMDGDAPGEQHVGRDDREQQGGAQQTVHAEQREGERPHAAEQHHVLAGDRHDVQEAAAAEVLDERRVHPLVVAEDHALQHVRDRRMDTSGEMSARRQTEAVDDALQPPAAAGHHQIGEVALEQDVLAMTPQVAAVVERAGTRVRERLDAHRGEP